MFTFLIVLILLVCLLLILVVLMQNKGQGMTMNSSANQIFGASRTTDLIEKTTWVLAGVLVLLVVVSAAFSGGGSKEVEQFSSPSIQRAKEINTPAGEPSAFPQSQPSENGSQPQPQTPSEPLTE
jgi:preprotein translocase subunit SecG